MVWAVMKSRMRAAAARRGHTNGAVRRGRALERDGLGRAGVERDGWLGLGGRRGYVGVRRRWSVGDGEADRGGLRRRLVVTGDGNGRVG